MKIRINGDIAAFRAQCPTRIGVVVCWKDGHNLVKWLLDPTWNDICDAVAVLAQDDPDYERIELIG